MNPTIIVQQNIGIPAGPLNDETSPSPSQKTTQPVAAIIRPMPRESGESKSLRLDQARPDTPKPHARTFELEDYVSWLKEKFEQDKADTRPLRTKTETTQATASVVPPPQELAGSPARSMTTDTMAGLTDFVLSDSFFSTITTESDFSDPISSISPASTEIASATDKADGLPTPDETRQDNDVQEITADAAIPEPEPIRVYSTAKLERVDPSHATLPKAYATFDELTVGDKDSPSVSFDSELLKSTRTTPVAPEPKKLNAEETEKFIATISKAIASVLTETPEPEFEQKVRSHFETELHARAERAITPTEIAAVDTNKLDHSPLAGMIQSGANSLSEIKQEADKIASEIINGGRKEIPTNVAAWDVEDFRWPVVTNQMIVSGGEALDQLSQSTFDMLTPANQRVAIAGLGRGEGTTSIAISLARWAAACGKNVLLVDADLVTPGLSSQVGLGPNLSWINAVSQSLPPAETIVRSQKSNLCVMPLAQMVSRVTWPRFIYDNLGTIIDQVRNNFDLIILDVGPANQLMAELSRPSLLADATLLVHDGVDSPEFKRTKSRLEMFGLNKFIVAQNRAQQISANVA